MSKVGVDILSDRRPERLPELDLSEILTVENIVPVPDWLIERAAIGRQDGTCDGLTA
ncbi:hypothetical protein [Variovorax paradoxus]|nr:hypothetical protein [Variovorax paradoxus]